MARPRGVWSDKPWREAIRKAVSKRTADGGKSLEKLAEDLIGHAEAGQGWAFAEIGNRLDGKPHQSSDVTITDERMLVDAPIPDENAEDWAAKHKPH